MEFIPCFLSSLHVGVGSPPGSVNSQAALGKRCSVRPPSGQGWTQTSRTQTRRVFRFLCKSNDAPAVRAGLPGGGNNPCHHAASPEMAPGKGDGFPRPRPTQGCYLRLLGAQTHPNFGRQRAPACHPQHGILQAATAAAP